MCTINMLAVWGYPPWINFYFFMLFFLLTSIVASIIVPAYRAWADRRNRPQEIAEVSLKVEPPEPGTDPPRIRSGYLSMFLLLLGALWIFVKGSPPIRIFLAVSIVGGTAITMLIRYLAGHQPSISLDQSPDMTDAERGTTLEQNDHDSFR